MSDAIDRKHPGITDEQRARFLEIVAANQGIGNEEALKQAGVWGTGGELRKIVPNDEELRRQVRQARGYGDDTVRREIARRAIDGVEEPVFWQGQEVGKIRKYSDRLLTMVAKAHLPEYRDQADLNVNVAGTVGIEDRSATLDAVAAVLHSVGAVRQRGGTAGELLPAPEEVLAEPPDS